MRFGVWCIRREGIKEKDGVVVVVVGVVTNGVVVVWMEGRFIAVYGRDGDREKARNTEWDVEKGAGERG